MDKGIPMKIQGPFDQYDPTTVTSQKKLNADVIKNALSPSDFYRHELKHPAFKKPGWNDGGLCPFHSDNNPGSFRVNVLRGAFICFSCGVNGGDIISFTMALYGLNFIEALTKLATDWGLI
jgi:DNA primase